MCVNSREKFLEQSLSILRWNNALDALALVRNEMNAEKGYTRHNGTHYYYHPVDVAQKLINFGIRDEDIIVAALLHDIVEDVPYFNIKIIQDKFGERVAIMVNLVTKKPNINYKISENLNEYLDNISKNYGAALIKTVDRIHNFGTLKDATPDKKIRQANETQLYFIPFFKKCRNMYPRYAYIFFEAKTSIEPHLWEIQEHYKEINELKEKIKKLEKELEYQQDIN